ncbi:MAG TPA: hypothetical protein VFO65_11320 [Acidimicrobiales bacterium]|nr:hypothetical protein [Acidimicrobiales bacterium]
MTVLLATVVGFLAARLGWVMLRPMFASEALARQNFRGRMVPTGAGLVLAVAGLAVEGGRVVAGAAAGREPLIGGARLGMLVLVVGLALLGLVDDLVGGPGDRGFRGHVRAMLRGQLTTGGLKLVGGGLVALLAVAATRPDANVAYLLADAALVALAANLANLFDRAPGRTIKVGAVAFAVLVATTLASPRLAAAAVVVGAALALLRADLHERLMLGDTGANVIGGALGLAVVNIGSPVVRLAVLATVAILNGISEQVSFSRVIESVPPFRLLDRAGRRP